VTEPVLANPSLLQRIDVLAVVNPRANLRTIWFSGLIAIVCLIRVVLAATTDRWAIALLCAAAAVLSGLLWFVSQRARRRAPATKLWLEGLTNR
jgi:uncharacterized membrane protein HdeD (DUF308 family)